VVCLWSGDPIILDVRESVGRECPSHSAPPLLEIQPPGNRKLELLGESAVRVTSRRGRHRDVGARQPREPRPSEPLEWM